MSKVVQFTDKDITYVHLSKGLYLIEGKYIDITNYTGDKVQVKDTDNICPVTRTNVVNHYTVNGEDNMSVEDYNNRIAQLSKYKTDEDGERTWESLDAEFEFRKFKELYKPIYKNVEVIGDPIKFNLFKTVLDTGNKFITSNFVYNTTESETLFKYDRPAALLSIVSECFKSLGMEYQGGLSYGKTDGKKVWSNSTHSGIRYVIAFNTYLFNDRWNHIYSKSGELETLIASYNSDKDEIEKIIKTKYNLHFGIIDEGKFDFKKMLDLLKTCQRNVNKVDPKTKTYSDLQSAKNLLNKSIELIEQSYKEE